MPVAMKSKLCLLWQHQNYAFWDNIPSRGKKLKTNTDAKMDAHPKSASAENNLYNGSYYIIQKRKIAQRYACQSKTLAAHVLPPQNHIGESVSACLWPLLSGIFSRQAMSPTWHHILCTNTQYSMYKTSSVALYSNFFIDPAIQAGSTYSTKKENVQKSN